MVLAAVVTVLWLLFAGLGSWPWLLATVSIVLVAALAAPTALRPVHALLLRVGHVVSKVVNPLLLGLVYFVIITPMGLVMRTFGYDPMRRKRDHAVESYRESSDDTAAQRYDRPF
jgi:large-conductance mechanosensitive channel